MALLDAAGNFIAEHMDLDVLIAAAGDTQRPEGHGTLPSPPPANALRLRVMRPFPLSTRTCWKAGTSKGGPR